MGLRIRCPDLPVPYRRNLDKSRDTPCRSHCSYPDVLTCGPRSRPFSRSPPWRHRASTASGLRPPRGRGLTPLPRDCGVAHPAEFRGCDLLTAFPAPAPASLAVVICTYTSRRLGQLVAAVESARGQASGPADEVLV